MTREEAVRSVNEAYDRTRQAHEAELRRRENEAVRADPEIGTLLGLRAALPLQSLKLAMADRAHAAAVAGRMREEGMRLNREIRSRLAGAGFAEDYLQMRYDCPDCRDTGYLDGVPARMCACFEKKIREAMRESDGVCAFDTQNFETFDLSRIPEVPVAENATQRQYTQRVRELCEEYADAYPDTFRPNLMLTGEAGLGKTFLLNCVAARVEERGHAATMVTAYHLLEIMRDRHFHMEETGGEFERLMNAGLLLIDDLGTEPMLRNITQEYLFILLNDRVSKRRHTVIATNLTFPQLKERYGERIMSRLADTSLWDHMRLLGKDLRRA